MFLADLVGGGLGCRDIAVPVIQRLIHYSSLYEQAKAKRQRAARQKCCPASYSMCKSP